MLGSLPGRGKHSLVWGLVGVQVGTSGLVLGCGCGSPRRRPACNTTPHLTPYATVCPCLPPCSARLRSNPCLSGWPTTTRNLGACWSL